jgi:hypothetical protein
MRNQISIAAAGLGLLGATLAVQAQAASLAHNAPNETSSEPFFFYCLSDRDMQNTFYLSPTKRSDAGVSRQNLEKSFRASLAQKYKYPNTGLISCPFLASGSTQARTEADRQRIINNLHSGHYDVVETDWTYNPSAAIPSAASITPSVAATGNPARGAVAPAPSAASAGPVGPKQDVSRPRVASVEPAGRAIAPKPTPYAVCVASERRGPTVYFSASFDGTKPGAQWANKYREFLRKTYGLGIVPVQCKVQKSLAEAQTFAQEHMDALRPTQKIVETGWKYE